jgi:hypothetical protein
LQKRVATLSNDCSENFNKFSWNEETTLSKEEHSKFFLPLPCLLRPYNDKKENKIFLIYKEIQRDRVQSHIWLTAFSYIGKNLRISSYTVLGSPPHKWLCILSHLNFLIYKETFVFFFISVRPPSPLTPLYVPWDKFVSSSLFWLESTSYFFI